MKPHCSFLALLYLALAMPAAAQARGTGPVVDAPAGKVEGGSDGAIRVFKGIPYALPPIRARRWQAPSPMPRWQGVRPAHDYGAACMQSAPLRTGTYARSPMPVSEDCLTLNIWAPKDARGAPVFFWIHGGSLVGGSSREEFYDGRRLAERGIIVVSINYRLGVLGYLAHPQLSSESPRRVSGNYGLLDQIEALRWVRRNIGAFGGDPAKVTIAGESAGALSVMYLMVSPPARGLFRSAIAESAYMISMPELKRSVHGAPSGEAVGQMLQSALQAPDIATMRGMDAQTLTDTAGKLGFFPWGLVDGQVLPEQMVTAFDEGKQAPVPILAGFNQGEIRSLTVLAPKPAATAAAYEEMIRDRYGELAEAFLKLYPSAAMQESIYATTRDALYGWTAERLVRKQTALGQPAFLYLFDHGYPSADAAGLHAFHASELPYVFGTLNDTPINWPKIPDSESERALSTMMIDYWASFTRNAAPKSNTGPAWPAYGSTGHYMHFADTPRAATGLMPGMFALNEEIMCRRRAAGKIGWNWNVGLASPKLPPKSVDCGSERAVPWRLE
jgi:para-nitrobenzyl esterase